MTAPQLTAYIQGVTVVNADGLNTFEQTCDNFVQLQGFVGVQGNQVYCRGGVSINDGLEGPFYWNASGTANDGMNNIDRKSVV